MGKAHPSRTGPGLALPARPVQARSDGNINKAVHTHRQFNFVRFTSSQPRVVVALGEAVKLEILTCCSHGTSHTSRQTKHLVISFWPHIRVEVEDDCNLGRVRYY